MRQAGDRVPKPVKVKAHVRAAPSPKKPPVPRKQGQSLTQAPNLKVPKSRGHAPTVFNTPLSRTPTQRMQAQQQRVTTRAVRGVEGKPTTRVTTQQVKALSTPEAKGIVKSAQPYVAKAKQHKSLFQKLAGAPGKALHAAEEFGKGGLARQSGQSSPAPGTKAVAKGLQAAVDFSGKLSDKATSGTETQTAGIGPAAHLKAGVSKELNRALKDVVQTPANTLQSFYMAGTDSKDVVKGLADQVKHPVKSLEEHPVNTLLALRGIEGGLSRAAGATARSGALGDAAKEYASTERAPLKLTGNATVQRRASKGLVENRVQKAIDKRALKPSEDFPKGRGTYVRETRGGKPVIVDAIHATEKQKYGGALGQPVAGHLNRRVDQEVGTNSGVLKNRRTNVLRAMHPKSEPVKALKGHEDAVPLVMEGELKHGDIKKLGGVQKALTDAKNRLLAERPTLKSESRKTLNQQNIDHIDALLADKEFLADPSHVFKAAEDYIKVHGNSITTDGLEGERIKYGDFTKQQAQLRVIRPYAIREMGLKWNDGAFEDAAGNPVSFGTILKHFKDAGGKAEHLGYVHQFQELDNPKSFRGGAGGMVIRPGGSQKFTGANTLRGTYHRSWAGLAEQLAHASARVARHENTNELVNNFGHVKNGLRYFKNSEITPDFLHDLEAKTGEKYVAVTAARQTVPETLMDELHPAELDESFMGVGPHDQHVVLFPRKVLLRIQQHENLRANNVLTKGIQTATQYFRHAVLPTSTKWVVGNTVEAALRSAVHGPRAVTAMARGVARGTSRLQEDLASLPGGDKALERLQVGASSGIFGSQHFNDFYRPDEGDVMGFVHKIRSTPGPKQVGDAWDWYADKVFRGNARLESSVYFAALDTEARAEVQSTLGAWHKTLKLAGPAYEDVAKGLLDSNNRARYVDAVDRMRGRYTNLSPSGRTAINSYAPFAPWYINALRFIYLTLPASHPVLTGTAAALVTATSDKRKDLGLAPWKEGTVAGRDFNRFTPAGIFSGGSDEASGNIKSLLLPQVSGILANLGGKDWTGKDLPPESNKYGVAFNTALETFYPFLSRARTVREKGGTALPNSTFLSPKTKPGTSSNIGAGFGKAFYPFRPISKGASSSTNPYDSVGSQNNPYDLVGSGSSNPYNK